MKKIVSILLVLVTVLSMGTMAFADGTTTLTTTVPDAEYTLNIPANTEVPFGQTRTEIGTLTVTEAKGFAVDKNLNVTVVYDAFKPDSSDINTTIPFNLLIPYNLSETKLKESGTDFVFKGKSNGSVDELSVTIDERHNQTRVENIIVEVASENWGRALAGNYTATITFTAKVVVEE